MHNIVEIVTNTLNIRAKDKGGIRNEVKGKEQMVK